MFFIMQYQALVLLFSLLAASANAQFQFFDQFFSGHGGQQQQQEKGNVPSDSSWYQQTWDSG